MEELKEVVAFLEQQKGLGLKQVDVSFLLILLREVKSYSEEQLLTEFQEYYNKDVELIDNSEIHDYQIEAFLNKKDTEQKGLPLKLKENICIESSKINTGNTVLLISNKDGTTNIWSNGVSLCVNLDTDGINKAYNKLSKQ